MEEPQDATSHVLVVARLNLLLANPGIATPALAPGGGCLGFHAQPSGRLRHLHGRRAVETWVRRFRARRTSSNIAHAGQGHLLRRPLRRSRDPRLVSNGNVRSCPGGVRGDVASNSQAPPARPLPPLQLRPDRQHQRNLPGMRDRDFDGIGPAIVNRLSTSPL